MNIAIINGSPKGGLSVTVRAAEFLARRLPAHRYHVLHVAARIRRLEASRERGTVFAALAAADAVIWTFPVYFNLVPAQLKRFVELLFEHGASVLAGKYATSISTSANFYDHLAHEYVQGICEDLGMRYLPGLSFDDSFLLTPASRATLRGFGSFFLQHVDRQILVERAHEPLRRSPFVFSPEGAMECAPKDGPPVTLLTDASAGNASLNAMIEVFCRRSRSPVEVVRLRSCDIRSGCVGCLRCSEAGRCALKDGFEALFREKVLDAHTLVFAGTVCDRYLSSLWKTFFDRGFFNGHRPFLRDKLVGFLVSGPLRQLPAVREGLEAMMQVARAQLIGFASDEDDDQRVVAARIDALAAAMELRAGEAWRRPPNFLGVGGHKIFRDLVYRNRPFMRADHQHYRDHGLYDYPQRDWRRRLKNLFLSLLLALPGARRGGMTRRMVAPYTRALARSP